MKELVRKELVDENQSFDVWDVLWDVKAKHTPLTHAYT